MAGLDEWHAIDPGSRDRRAVLIGSSTTQGTVSLTNRGWPEELRLLMQPRWGKGGIGHVQPLREGWTFTTGGNAWTDEAAGAADAGSSGGNVKTAALATCIATYTVASDGGIAADGFYLYFMDKSGSGTPSYSVDGGSFVNVPGITFSGSETVKRSTLISSAYTTTVRVRAGNAAGTNQQVSFHGIDPVDLAGSDVNGCIVDNYGRNADFLGSPARSAGVALGKTFAVTDPDLIVVMYTNDLVFWGIGGEPRGQFWTDNLETMLDVAGTAGASLLPVVYFARGDVDTAQELTDQDDLRERTHDFADANDLEIVDLRDYHETFAAASGAGLLADNVHPTEAGCEFIADKVWRKLSRTGNETFVRV